MGFLNLVSLVLLLVVPAFAEVDPATEADPEPVGESVGGSGPILPNPGSLIESEAKINDGIAGIVGTLQDWAGQEGAVYATHYLFLNGEYENGTWFLPNNTTIA